MQKACGKVEPHMIRHGLRALVAALLLVHAGSSAAQSPSPFFYPIPRLHRERPAEELFGIQGYVVMMSECPPCPKDAVCATCEPPYIIVSARNSTLDSAERMTSREVRLQTNHVSGLVRGEHYRFLIRNAAGAKDHRGRLAFDLVEFHKAPAGDPSLILVDDPARLATVKAVVQERLWKDFSLDHLPDASTLALALKYLTTASSSTIVREALTGVPAVYGLELTMKDEQDTLRVFVFASRPDFHGEIVYAVSQLGSRWPVFVSRTQDPSQN